MQSWGTESVASSVASDQGGDTTNTIVSSVASGEFTSQYWQEGPKLGLPQESDGLSVRSDLAGSSRSLPGSEAGSDGTYCGVDETVVQLAELLQHLTTEQLESEGAARVLCQLPPQKLEAVAAVFSRLALG
mmetsp:Transcript_41940/g.94596  ORF Transcript_41940/g.94596 Transcript_41940/m.94596 type:complete len:131 (+) Transcript_41940:2-394(+)